MLLKEKINALRTKAANSQDEVNQIAINQQYNLSFSGGSEKATYYFSAGNYNEEGTTSGTAFNRYNLTMKTDYNLLKNLKLGTALFVTKSKRKSYMTDENAFINPANYTRTVNPYQPIRDEFGD